jgi:serine protease AprX
MDQTVINGNARPASGDADAVSVASFAAPPPSVAESNYILIQTTGPLSAENKEALANTEVHLLEYKGNNVYLCGYKPKTFDPITQHLSFVEKAEVVCVSGV